MIEIKTMIILGKGTEGTEGTERLFWDTGSVLFYYLDDNYMCVPFIKIH